MTGLTEKEIQKNRELYGSNIIDEKSNNSFMKLLLETLGDPIIRILLIALGIKTIFLFRNFDWYETIGIVIAIFIASFISTISEYGSEQAFNRMQEETSKIKSKVIRDSRIQEIDIEEIVVNDIVVLETGDKIPADGKVISGSITVDESLLTGETKEKNKKIGDLLYKGTIVYSKHCNMIATDVGKKTLYGKVALELKTKSPESPLKIRLRELARIISKIGYFSAFLVSFAYLFSVIVMNNNFNIDKIIGSVTNIPFVVGHLLYALTLSVTIIVVSVPEGLPMMITLVLSSNMKKMLQNNVLVRKLVGIETAGSLNILFTDKTGTLTKGKLEVIKFVDSELNQYKRESDIKDKLNNILTDSILYNTTSEFNDGKIIGGNTTDRALLGYIKPSNKKYEIISSIPFDSKNKYMVTTIKKDKKIKLIKGAPEKILPYCTKFYNEYGMVRTLYNKFKIKDCMNNYLKQGIRIIMIATSDTETDTFKDLTLVGMMLIKDDIREEAKQGLELVKRAHINTVMITGDNKETATSIGEDLNMINDDSIIITSEELNTMNDEEIKQIIPNLAIVARALPSDKCKLIKLSRELNLIVGMTGDGVNDAPALKQADIGFSMGSGTEVAKEASDIVILDDNFLSISKAILFGRTIFKSIRKFIIFQLTVNICAISLSVIGPFIGINTPITVIQMLWINMVMDTLAGLAFSFEPPLLEYMDEYPKNKNESIVNKYMINEILIAGFYSSIICILFLKVPFFREIFKSEQYFMTGFFGLFIFISLFNAFNARTYRINIFANIFRNKMFVFIISLVIFIQLILIYYGGELFRTTGLSLLELSLIIFLALTIVPIDWIRKYIYKKNNNDKGV